MSSLKTIGGKDEPNIVFYAEIVTTSQHRTQNVKTNNRTAKKTKNLLVTCGRSVDFSGYSSFLHQ